MTRLIAEEREHEREREREHEHASGYTWLEKYWIDIGRGPERGHERERGRKCGYTA